MQYNDLFDFLRDVEQRILAYLESSDVRKNFNPQDLSDSVLSYVLRPAKRLRPSVLLMAAGALGGSDRERLAIPAAAGIELFHTWTLIHDDVIDNDKLRRGGPTVHEAMSNIARSRYGLSDQLAWEYGRDVAILSGDVQHGWAISTFSRCGLQGEVDSTLILRLVDYLQSYVLGNLMFGCMLDVQYGMREFSELQGVDEDQIIRMLWLKTGLLFEFAGMAGAVIGQNTADLEDPKVRAITQFASKCGTAFQLQDDILGIVGNEESLGKPVGSDIREGKKTVIVCESLKRADDSQRKRILATLGNRHATPEDVREVAQLFGELNGIQRTRDLAAGYIGDALPHLDALPDTQYKHLLLLWANYMLDRGF